MLEAIHTEKAPKAVGPYSQAIRAGNFVYTSGQLPTDAETGSFVSDVPAEQARQCLKNVEHILKNAGLTLNDVVKCLVFLQDMNDFKAVNEVYAEVFGEHKPARSAFQVAKLPMDAKVEIEAIAYKE